MQACFVPLFFPTATRENPQSVASADRALGRCCGSIIASLVLGLRCCEARQGSGRNPNGNSAGVWDVCLFIRKPAVGVLYRRLSGSHVGVKLERKTEP